MARKFKNLGENENPIQDFVNKIKNVKKNSGKSFEIGVKTCENFLIQIEKYNIWGKWIRYKKRHVKSIFNAALYAFHS